MRMERFSRNWGVASRTSRRSLKSTNKSGLKISSNVLWGIRFGQSCCRHEENGDEYDGTHKALQDIRLPYANLNVFADRRPIARVRAGLDVNHIKSRRDIVQRQLRVEAIAAARALQLGR